MMKKTVSFKMENHRHLTQNTDTEGGDTDIITPSSESSNVSSSHDPVILESSENE